MSRRRLADLSDNISSGVYKDPGNDRVPLWADGNNIVFDKEGPRPVHGFSALFSKPASQPVRGVLQAWISGGKFIFFGNADNLYVYDVSSDNVAEVSKTTDGYSGEYWTFMQWGDWVIASNDVDPVQVYKGTAFADLTTGLGSSLICTLIRGFRAHAVALGTDDEGREIKWCDEDDVENWVPEIANAAGSLFIRDLDSPIRAAAASEAGIYFYGDSTAHILQWTGPPFYFGSQLLRTNIGALGPYAVVAVGNIHFGMGLNGIWLFDGRSEPQYIDTPAIHNYVYNNLDFNNAKKCNAWYDEEQRLIIFSFPSKSRTSGEPELSVCLSLDQQAWCPLDFAATGASKTPVFRYTTAFDFQGNAYQHGVKGAGGGGQFDSQQFISMSDELTFENDYGISGYGIHGYGGV